MSLLIISISSSNNGDHYRACAVHQALLQIPVYTSWQYTGVGATLLSTLELKAAGTYTLGGAGPELKGKPVCLRALNHKCKSSSAVVGQGDTQKPLESPRSCGKQ